MATVTGVNHSNGMTATQVQRRLEQLEDHFASSSGGGMVGIVDTDGNFTATDVEGALTELAEAKPKTTTVASSATPAIDTDVTNIFTITALAAAITSMTTNLTGSPANGQALVIRILDNGLGPYAIAWGAKFASRGVSLPITTVTSKYLYVGLIWNSTTTTWDCIAASQEV